MHIGKYTDGKDRICNHNCIFCIERMEPGESNQVLPSANQIATALGKYVELKGSPDRLYVAGGEPTMREDLGEILSIAKKICNDVVLSTNCDFENSEYLIKLLKNVGIKKVATSLHGSNAEIHDKITGTPGSFLRTTNIIKKLSESDIKLSVNIVICRENVAYMPDILTTILKTLPVKKIIFTHFSFHGYAFFYPELLFSAFEYKDVIGKTIEKAAKTDVPVLFRDFPVCVDERLANMQENVDDADIISLNHEQSDIACSEASPKMFRKECKICRHFDNCPKFLLSNYNEGMK